MGGMRGDSVRKPVGREQQRIEEGTDFQVIVIYQEVIVMIDQMSDRWKRPVVWMAGLGWLNLAGLSWGVVLRWMPVDTIAGLIWALFFLFAVGVTAMALEGAKTQIMLDVNFIHVYVDPRYDQKEVAEEIRELLAARDPDVFKGE